MSGLDPNTPYDFQVRARGDGSPYSYTYGSPSTSVSRTTDPPTAPAPTGLRATASTETSVSLSWNAVTDAHYYKVEYRRSSSSSWLHAGYTFGTSRTVSGLDPNTPYEFQVRARGRRQPLFIHLRQSLDQRVEDHRLSYSPRSHRPPCNCIYRDQCQPELE